MALRQGIERLLEQGRLPEAHAAAKQLLQRALAAGEEAYAGAAYDIAMAHNLIGQVLSEIGAAEEALSVLADAGKRFQALVRRGNRSAETMASAVISRSADCLTTLGRFAEAATLYEEEAIRGFEKLNDRRWVAVSRGQLGTVRLHQKRYGEALESYREALRIFESLGEPGSVAAAWHQIGRVHGEVGQFEQGEQAYRQSLAICVQQQDRAGEARSLNDGGTATAAGKVAVRMICAARPYLNRAESSAVPYVVGNRKGVASRSPRLPYSATLGVSVPERFRSNPTGVVAEASH